MAVEKRVIGSQTLDALKPYLAFRHFFSHAYALDLQASRMESLAANVHRVFDAFHREINATFASDRP